MEGHIFTGLVQAYREVGGVCLWGIGALGAARLQNVVDVEVVVLFDGRLDRGGAGASSGKAGCVVAGLTSAALVRRNAILGVYIASSASVPSSKRELHRLGL